MFEIMNPHILINNEEDDAVAFNGKMPISANPTVKKFNFNLYK